MCMRARERTKKNIREREKECVYERVCARAWERKRECQRSRHLIADAV